ncbi:hypothetical protein [Nitrosomonas sp. Nm33]|uniref:hypothetical protein n=1 Tax=Nitrosomonas sp. Nm33 TaxID=133724 RepID=UPI0015A47DB1|nr:hypothetical protein [Nitrosomonas sp. Nm33]
MVIGSQRFFIGAELVETGIDFCIYVPGRHVVKLMTEPSKVMKVALNRSKWC